jgi:hypothetical protein
LLALAIRRQDERALFRPYENPYTAHHILLPQTSRLASGFTFGASLAQMYA